MKGSEQSRTEENVEEKNNFMLSKEFGEWLDGFPVSNGARPQFERNVWQLRAPKIFNSLLRFPYSDHTNIGYFDLYFMVYTSISDFSSIFFSSMSEGSFSNNG